MKTPRIEEMVEEFEKLLPEDLEVDYKKPYKEILQSTLYTEELWPESMLEVDRDKVADWLRTALTQAHQAGIDEGKYEERVKWQKYQDQVESIFAWLQGENGDFPDLSQKPHYSFRSQLRTMRKALQDNK